MHTQPHLCVASRRFNASVSTRLGTKSIGGRDVLTRHTKFHFFDRADLGENEKMERNKFFVSAIFEGYNISRCILSNIEFPVPPHLLFTRVRVLAVRGGKGNLVFFSFFRRQTFQDQKRQPHATRVYYKAHNHPVPSPNALNLRVTLTFLPRNFHR